MSIVVGAVLSIFCSQPSNFLHMDRNRSQLFDFNIFLFLSIMIDVGFLGQGVINQLTFPHKEKTQTNKSQPLTPYGMVQNNSLLN